MRLEEEGGDNYIELMDCKDPIWQRSLRAPVEYDAHRHALELGVHGFDVPYPQGVTAFLARTGNRFGVPSLLILTMPSRLRNQALMYMTATSMLLVC